MSRGGYVFFIKQKTAYEIRLSHVGSEMGIRDRDSRATLIGNVHFDKKKGTYFSESVFVKAIQTPNAVILLDELSRTHPLALIHI